MNTICQDRDIMPNALACAGIRLQKHACALMRIASEKARFKPHLHDVTRIDTQAQVGKKRAGSWQSFANWILSANRCQLNSLDDQRLSDFPVQLAVGSWQYLPTEPSTCFHSLSPASEVGEISPSYYVGEGADALSPLRREMTDSINTLTASRTVVLAIDLGTTTGWAMRTLEGQLTHGFTSFRPSRYEAVACATCALSAGSVRYAIWPATSTACTSKKCAGTPALMLPMSTAVCWQP